MIADFLRHLFNPNYKTDSTSLIEQFMYPKKGPGQLWEKMASEIEKWAARFISDRKQLLS